MTPPGIKSRAKVAIIPTRKMTKMIPKLATPHTESPFSLSASRSEFEIDSRRLSSVGLVIILKCGEQWEFCEKQTLGVKLHLEDFLTLSPLDL